MLGILATYGFEQRNRYNGKVLWWGIGSLVWGYTAEVRRVGKNLYEVEFHEWDYNEWGDPVVENTEVSTMYGATMLSYLMERLPVFNR